MKKTKIIYWIFTSLFAFLMLGSAIPDIFSVQAAVEGFQKMGMPAYLLPFLGIAKTLGVIAILIPGYPHIKEWAYAGLVFDLLGATYSIIASGQPAVNWMFMALPLLLAAGSYTWYHKRLKASAAIKNQVKYNCFAR
ncbi:MAG: DoxX family protein [Segetibacter sp.]